MELSEILTTVPPPLLADTFDDHHGWGDGWWVVMAVGMLVFWAAVIAVGIWLVRGLSGRGRTRDPGGDTAFEILDRRLAEGEISTEEYEERRRTLLEAREASDGGG